MRTAERRRWDDVIAEQEAWSVRCDHARALSDAERLRAVYEWMRAARDGSFSDPSRDPVLTTQPHLPGMQLVGQLYVEAHEPEPPLPELPPAPDGYVNVFAREPRREIPELAESARRCCAAACAAYDDSPESFAAALQFAWRALCVGLRAEWRIVEVTAPARRRGVKVRNGAVNAGKKRKAVVAWARVDADLQALHARSGRVSWTAACRTVAKDHGVKGKTIQRYTRVRW